MIASIILGILIFGYAGWAFYRHIQKSKKGKCASCSLNDSCKTNSCACQPLMNRSDDPKREA